MLHEKEQAEKIGRHESASVTTTHVTLPSCASPRRSLRIPEADTIHAMSHDILPVENKQAITIRAVESVGSYTHEHAGLGVICGMRVRNEDVEITSSVVTEDGANSADASIGTPTA